MKVIFALGLLLAVSLVSGANDEGSCKKMCTKEYKGKGTSGSPKSDCQEDCDKCVPRCRLLTKQDKSVCRDDCKECLKECKDESGDAKKACRTNCKVSGGTPPCPNDVSDCEALDRTVAWTCDDGECNTVDCTGDAAVCDEVTIEVTFNGRTYSYDTECRDNICQAKLACTAETYSTTGSIYRLCDGGTDCGVSNGDCDESLSIGDKTMNSFDTCTTVNSDCGSDRTCKSVGTKKRCFPNDEPCFWFDDSQTFVVQCFSGDLENLKKVSSSPDANRQCGDGLVPICHQSINDATITLCLCKKKCTSNLECEAYYGTQLGVCTSVSAASSECTAP